MAPIEKESRSLLHRESGGYIVCCGSTPLVLLSCSLPVRLCECSCPAMMNTVCATSCNAMAFVPFPLVSTTPFLSPQVGLPAAAISKRSLLPVKGLNILRQPSSQRARILASAASENPPQKIYKRLTVFSDGVYSSIPFVNGTSAEY